MMERNCPSAPPVRATAIASAALPMHYRNMIMSMPTARAVPRMGVLQAPQPLIRRALQRQPVQARLVDEEPGEALQMPQKNDRIYKPRKPRSGILWTLELDIAMFKAWVVARLYDLIKHGQKGQREKVFNAEMLEKKAAFGGRVCKYRSGRSRIENVMRIVKQLSRKEQRADTHHDDNADDNELVELQSNADLAIKERYTTNHEYRRLCLDLLARKEAKEQHDITKKGKKARKKMRAAMKGTASDFCSQAALGDFVRHLKENRDAKRARTKFRSADADETTKRKRKRTKTIIADEQTCEHMMMCEDRIESISSILSSYINSTSSALIAYLERADERAKEEREHRNAARAEQNQVNMAILGLLEKMSKRFEGSVSETKTASESDQKDPTTSSQRI